MKALKKGDAVLLFRDYDRAGTIKVTSWVVRSSGKQITHLMSAAGNLEERLNTSKITDVDLANAPCNACGLVRRLSDVKDVNAFALSFAQVVIDYQRTHLTRCLTTSNEPGYQKSIQSLIAAIHEPRVIDAR